MYTLEDLKTRIAETVDEISILEILDINAEDLVEKFEDRIEERFDQLMEDLFPEDEEDNETS